MARQGVEKNESEISPHAWTNAQGGVVNYINSISSDDYFRILNVKRTDSFNAIKKAYKKYILLCHPDKNGHPGASQATQRIVNAYKKITAVERPWRYDYLGLYNRFQTTSRSTCFSFTRAQPEGARHASWELLTLALLVMFLITAGVLFLTVGLEYSLEKTDSLKQVRYTAAIGIQYHVAEDYVADPIRVFWASYHIERQYFDIIRSICHTELESIKQTEYNMPNNQSNMTTMVQLAGEKMDSCIDLLQLVEKLKYQYIRLFKEHFVRENGVPAGGWDVSPPCSKTMTEKYYLVRETWSLEVQYFVDEEFDKYYNDENIAVFEIILDEAYLSYILNDCKAEMMQRYIVGLSHWHAWFMKEIEGEDYSKITSCMEVIELFPSFTTKYLHLLKEESRYL